VPSAANSLQSKICSDIFIIFALFTFVCDFEELLTIEAMCRITFAPKEEHFPILPLNEYSPSERSQCWYSRDEKEEMIQKQKRARRRMEKKKKLRRNSSGRGLETTDRRNVKRMWKHALTTAIMEEQNWQWNNQTNDWENYARISRHASKDSIITAFMSAMRDEQEARLVYEDLGYFKKRRLLGKIFSIFQRRRFKVERPHTFKQHEFNPYQHTKGEHDISEPVSINKFWNGTQTVVETAFLTTKFLIVLAQSITYLLVGRGPMNDH
jgi:hypothetical protein